MKKAVMCIVKTPNQIEVILGQLQSAGFPSHDISVLYPNTEATRDLSPEQGNQAPEGAVAGAGAGGLYGGALGLLVGIGSLAIPGIGPFIAAGPILGAISGVAAGATVGGVAGALIGMGLPEHEARNYDGKIKGGNILISVHTENAIEQKRAEALFTAAQADNICSTGESTTTKTTEWHPAL